MTIAEVMQQDPAYFKHSIVSSQGQVLKVHDDLRSALEAEGVLADLAPMLPDLIRSAAESTLMRAEEREQLRNNKTERHFCAADHTANEVEEHREVKKLRKQARKSPAAVQAV